MRSLAVALLAVAALLAAGCSGSVAGQVSSETAKTPIPGATVTVGDQKTTTDASGRFAFDAVDTGDRPYLVEAEGFGRSTGKLTVERGENALNVTLRDGTVRGVLRENAEAPEPVGKAKVKVTIAGVRVKDIDGSAFTATSVPVGKREVEVTWPGHATLRETVDVAPGENSVKLALNLTPDETYMRYHDAILFKRFREAYRMVHPDVRRHYPYARFARLQRQFVDQFSVDEAKIGRVKLLAKWTPPYMDKTYRHVALVDRSLRVQYLGMTISDNTTQHWVGKDGRWYIHFDWRDR